MASASKPDAKAAWLKDFFPGYFALVMATGIVAMAAHTLRYPILSWVLFAIALAAYPVLWAVLIVRMIRFPRRVIDDFASHERGPTFLTIVAANGVLGGEFALFHVLTGLLPALFWFSLVLWVILVYGFLSAVTARIAKPDLEHGLNGTWLMLVVATEALSVLASLLALQLGATQALVFTALAFYLLGAMLYVLLSALIFFRWVFRPMHPAEMGAPWWINMGAVAIATLAGAQLMGLALSDNELAPFSHFIVSFTLLLWVTSSFWIPLLVILFAWKEMQRGPRGYDPGLWSAVFPLGMYAVATHDYASVAGFTFLQAIPQAAFWIALITWALSFIGMATSLLGFGKAPKL